MALPSSRPDPPAAVIGAIAAKQAKEAANDAAPDGWTALTGTGGTALAAATGLTAAEAISAYDLSGRAGEVTRLAARTPDGVIRLILLGVGDGSRPTSGGRALPWPGRSSPAAGRGRAAVRRSRRRPRRVHPGPAARRLHVLAA